MNSHSPILPSIELFNLSGRTALITGSSSGIGFALAQGLIGAGARVILNGRSQGRLNSAHERLSTYSTKLNLSPQVLINGQQKDRIVKAIFDVTSAQATEQAIEQIESSVGPIDILINNAGIHLKKYAQDTTDEDFANILHTNLQSVFALTRETAKSMLARKNGSIILISSMAGLFGIDRVSAYGTSKAALIGLMNNLVTEYSKDNVRINCIAPGWIVSEMFLNAIKSDPERKAKITNRIALPGFGTTEDIGNAAVYLSAPSGKYVTGAVLPVDGGATVNF